MKKLPMRLRFREKSFIGIYRLMIFVSEGSAELAEGCVQEMIAPCASVFMINSEQRYRLSVALAC